MKTEELKNKMNGLQYFLVKEAARDSSHTFLEFLEELEISDDDYKEIKKEWEKIGITQHYI